jgi:hypothetical protein
MSTAEGSNVITDIGAAEALWEAQEAIRAGVWPTEYLDALMAPVVELAGQQPVDFHHIGYTYPDRDSFEAAIEAAPGKLISSDMVTPRITHHRRYLRVPREGGLDTFIEHHLPGDEGNGIRGVHLDFVIKDAAATLERVESSLTPRALGADVVTQHFPGGFAPVGKVALQPLGTHLETGIMFRTSWSDPVDW